MSFKQISPRNSKPTLPRKESRKHFVGLHRPRRIPTIQCRLCLCFPMEEAKSTGIVRNQELPNRGPEHIQLMKIYIVHLFFFNHEKRISKILKFIC